MRLFAAIPIPEDLARRLSETCRDLGRRLPRVRWAPPQNLHLTLAFLGEVGEERLPALDKALGRALDGAAAFRLELAGLGAFPSEEIPRVVWAGVGAGRRELEALAARARTALAPFAAAPDDKPFAAHLTLGRWKDPPRRGVAPWRAAGSPERFGDFLADRVRLMQSTLLPDGPVYGVAREYPLTMTKEAP